MEREPQINNIEFEQQKAKEFWKDRNTRSVSFRRHSAYDYEGKDLPKGSLTSEGIRLTREEAKKWKEGLPPDSEVTIFESPSCMVAGERQFPQPHLLLPSRARQTASIYEQEVFGNLASAEEYKNSMGGDPLRPIQSKRRKRSYLLGDFMEYVAADRVQFIPEFFRTRNEVYGYDMKKFWQDYTREELDPRVQAALEKCGASSSKELAIHLADFLAELAETTESIDVHNNKKVDLCLTHGETMDSFLYFTSQYITNIRGPEAGLQLEEISFGYNQGFNAHLRDRQLFIEVGDVVYPVDDLKKFISFLKGNEKL